MDVRRNASGSFGSSTFSEEQLCDIDGKAQGI